MRVVGRVVGSNHRDQDHVCVVVSQYELAVYLRTSIWIGGNKSLPFGSLDNLFWAWMHTTRLIRGILGWNIWNIDNVSVFTYKVLHSVNLISVICILAIVPIFIGSESWIYYKKHPGKYFLMLVGAGAGWGGRGGLTWPSLSSLSRNKS